MTLKQQIELTPESPNSGLGEVCKELLLRVVKWVELHTSDGVKKPLQVLVDMLKSIKTDKVSK